MSNVNIHFCRCPLQNSPFKQCCISFLYHVRIKIIQLYCDLSLNITHVVVGQMRLLIYDGEYFAICPPTPNHRKVIFFICSFYVLIIAFSFFFWFCLNSPSRVAALIFAIKWAMSWWNLLMPDANNTEADQLLYPHSLISAFVVCCLCSMSHVIYFCQLCEQQRRRSACTFMQFDWHLFCSQLR